MYRWNARFWLDLAPTPWKYVIQGPFCFVIQKKDWRGQDGAIFPAVIRADSAGVSEAYPEASNMLNLIAPRAQLERESLFLHVHPDRFDRPDHWEKDVPGRDRSQFCTR